MEGKLAEWALIKRHPSEDVFGVQLADSDPEIMAKCAVLLANEAEIDFIDLNLGCPIDLVTKYGAGSALMNRPNKMKQMLSKIHEKTKGTLPVGIKMRKGWSKSKPTADKLCQKLQMWRNEFKWNLAYVAVHGRSRQQRYTKTADWSYIHQVCAKLHCREFVERRQEMKPLKVFGNGDILSYLEWTEHLAHVEDWFKQLDELELEDEQKELDTTVADVEKLKVKMKSSLTTCMLARGALIKPWLCQEIKEQRHIDISAEERLEMIKKFINYGLLHWGSDRKGVNNTRRYLLEWMSFLHRYVPVGILDASYVPQHINDRPPNFKGRNDLETLLGSKNVKDWVGITEMFLGKVEEDFNFVPKHKANSYDEPSSDLLAKIKSGLL